MVSMVVMTKAASGLQTVHSQATISLSRSAGEQMTAQLFIGF